MSAPHPHQPPPLLQQRYLKMILSGVIINTVVAALICYFFDNGNGFVETLIYSQCIGICCMVCIDRGRQIIWGDKQAGPLGMALLILGNVPLAYVLGTQGGRWISARVTGVDHALPQFLSNASIRMMMMILVVSIVATIFFVNREQVAELRIQAEREKTRRIATEKQALQAQLLMLQAQIEPHMLFNTLANLQALIMIDTDRAQHMLEHLITYLRATLTASREGSSTLEQEFKLLDAYLALMAIRMGTRLRYTLELPEALKTYRIPPMLLQPLVENAIKHGLEPKVEGGLVSVRASQTEQGIILCVDDDGLGLRKERMRTESNTNDRGAHIGLDNIRERATANFGERAQLELLPNQPQGVRARLILPT